jgi:F-type H+-transporting ATPase subunit b
MLQLNWSTLLLQILNFVVMVFILWRFLFKPVIRILDERSKKVTTALEEAEQRERQATEMRDEYEEKLAEARDQVMTMRQQAEEELARAKRQLLEDTRHEIDEMRHKAEAEIEEARRQAVYQHRRELGQLVTTLSAKMMRESTGEAFQRATMDQFIEQLGELPTEQYQQQLTDQAEGEVRVRLVSAQDLIDEQRKRIDRLVAEMAGHPVEIRYDVDPTLVAGATLRLGDVVVDGSTSGQLQELKERYMQDLERTTA